MNIEDITGEDAKQYTTCMSFRKVKGQEYHQMERFWNALYGLEKEPFKPKNHLYLKITEQLVATPSEGDVLRVEDYERMIRFLIGHEKADRLYVNDSGNTRKGYVRDLTETTIEERAVDLFYNPQKKNFFEIHFEKEGKAREPSDVDFFELDHAFIGFGVHDNTIVSYEAYFTIADLCLIDFETNNPKLKGFAAHWAPTSE
tara:strand:- start:774 stop:1376 length:603 start_codon:yes stop_codon:yes gene_type:complete